MSVDAAPVTVAVVSPYVLVRTGLAHLAGADSGRVRVVDTASHDGHLGDVDVVIYDLAGLSRPDSRGDLLHLLGSVAVVGLARDRREDLTDGARALGVRHLVPESVSTADLLDVLERAAGRTDDPHDRDPRDGRDPAVLTQRERAVLALVGAGLSNTEIAERLFVSINTVKTYIRGAYRKIGVTSRPQATLWAIRNGLRPDAD